MGMTSVEFADAVAAAIAARWPERTIYRDFCPKDFARPSFLLQVGDVSISTAGRDLVAWEVPLLLTLFDTVDERYEASAERLAAAQMDVLAVFGSGCLKVGDRVIPLEVSTGTRELDAAFVEISAGWLDTRALPPVPEHGGAEHVALRVAINN